MGKARWEGMIQETTEEREHGSVYFDPDLQSTCLEFSLGSGLDLLSELAVHSIERRIRKSEMKWMEKH